MLESTVLSRSPEDTERAGEALGRTLKRGDIVLLSGPLGSGKTVLVRGLARALGVTETVTSPSFLIVSEYEGAPPLVHVDLYRLQSPEELENLGLRDITSETAVTVVEWGERAADLLPPDCLRVSIEIRGAETRLISMRRRP